MGNPKAFLNIHRKEAGYRPVSDRIRDFGEVEQTLNQEDRRLQASRCMDCGVPFCHWSCPVGNKQPEWQDRLYKNDVKGAYKLLTQTNDFPEFTGRICPALCEKSCVLNKFHEPVTIRENEAAIAERVFTENMIEPNTSIKRNGKKVAVIGSGPSGLACANRLNHKGYEVTVFEKNESIGGLLRFGIPDFKLNKAVVDRRIDFMAQEGIKFQCNTLIGKDITMSAILKDFDAVCLAMGAEVPRDLKVPGRDQKGVYFALEFLQQQNRIVAGGEFLGEKKISAKGKNVLVIGGGDTGSDCVGTANRQGAKSVTQIEIMPKPPVGDNPATQWPYWPLILKTTSSHEEGCNRRWLLDTKEVKGTDGKVSSVVVETVKWEKNPETQKMDLIHTGETDEIKAELVLLAMGFVQPQHHGLIESLKLEFDGRNNIKVDENQMTNIPKIFAAGDVSTGASLVVKCIASGQRAAIGIDKFLKSI